MNCFINSGNARMNFTCPKRRTCNPDLKGSHLTACEIGRKASVWLHMMQCSSSSSCAVTSYHVAGTSMTVWIEGRSRLSDVSFGGFAVSPVWGRRVFLKQISQLSTCIIEQFHELDCFQRKLNQKIHCKYIPNMPQSLIMRTATMNCPQHREVFQYESNAAKKRLLDTWEFVQHPQSTSSAI